jgi:hypothetical protein
MPTTPGYVPTAPGYVPTTPGYVPTTPQHGDAFLHAAPTGDLTSLDTHTAFTTVLDAMGPVAGNEWDAVQAAQGGEGAQLGGDTSVRVHPAFAERQW